MEHGGEQDDTGSGCKRSMSASDATMNSAATKQQALRLAEDLSLPSVQVVVMSANMGCSHCRQRVTKVVSKMDAGLLDYMVDFGKKEVTVRGTVRTKKRKQQRKTKHKADKNDGVSSSWDHKRSSSSSSPNQGAGTLSWFLGCYCPGF